MGPDFIPDRGPECYQSAPASVDAQSDFTFHKPIVITALAQSWIKSYKYLNVAIYLGLTVQYPLYPGILPFSAFFTYLI
jgi:hypothetical protein